MRLRPAPVLVTVVVVALLGYLFTREPPTADTVSSVEAAIPSAPVPAPVCIEQLDASGNAIESFMAVRFMAVRGDERMIDAYHGIDPILVTGPAGMVAFETDDGRRLFLEPPWRIP